MEKETQKESKMKNILPGMSEKYRMAFLGNDTQDTRYLIAKMFVNYFTSQEEKYKLRGLELI